jgi:hypothetical protein
MHGGNVDLLLQNIVCVVSVLVPIENFHTSREKESHGLKSHSVVVK